MLTVTYGVMEIKEITDMLNHNISYCIFENRSAPLSCQPIFFFQSRAVEVSYWPEYTACTKRTAPSLQRGINVRGDWYVFPPDGPPKPLRITLLLLTSSDSRFRGVLSHHSDVCLKKSSYPSVAIPIYYSQWHHTLATVFPLWQHEPHLQRICMLLH